MLCFNFVSSVIRGSASSNASMWAVTESSIHPQHILAVTKYSPPYRHSILSVLIIHPLHRHPLSTTTNRRHDMHLWPTPLVAVGSAEAEAMNGHVLVYRGITLGVFFSSESLLAPIELWVVSRLGITTETQTPWRQYRYTPS